MIDPTFEALIRATEQPPYPVLPQLSAIQASEGDRAFESSVISQEISPFEMLLTCRDDGSFRRTYMGNYGDIPPVIRATSSDLGIELDGGFLRGFTNQDARVDFRMWKRRISDEEPAATVWILVGGPTAVIFPESIPTLQGLFRPWSMERGLRCNIGGAPALIRQLIDVPEFPKGESTAFAVARIGPCPEVEWLAALRVVLSLAVGTWLEPAFQYRTKGDGSLTWLRVDTINAFTNRPPTPAISAIHPGAMRVFGDQLERLLDRCKSLLADAVRIDVAMQYLLSSHNGTEAEIRDMCSAIDAIAESRLLEASHQRFISKKRLPVVRNTIDDFLKGLLPQEESGFRKRVGDILGLAVTDSSSEKQRQLWKATGIAINKPERHALQHRHAMSHPGFIAFDYDDNAQWQLVFRQSGLLRTLANRMLLSILGFAGNAQEYFGAQETAVVPVVLNSNGRIGRNEPNRN